MTYQPWRKESGRIVGDGNSIVDTSTGQRSRIVRGCGSSGQSDWLSCGSLTLARSLFGLVTAKVVLDGYRRATDTSPATDSQTLEVRATVVCRECGGRTSWSLAGCPSWTERWWLRSMGRLTDAGISTTFRLELRPDDQATKSVFGVWSESRINPEQEMNRLRLIGIATVDDVIRQRSVAQGRLQST